MTAMQILNALGGIDDHYVIHAKETATLTVSPRWKLWPLVAAIIGFLMLCGFTAYALGLFDP